MSFQRLTTGLSISVIEMKRAESEMWLRFALDKEVKLKRDSDTAKLMLKMYKAYQVKHEKLYRLSHTYAYEEMQKETINTQLRAGKT